MERKDRPGYLFTIHVVSIAVQPDNLKENQPKPWTLEVLGLKRAVIEMSVEKGDVTFGVAGILEFRGDHLTLTGKDSGKMVGDVAVSLGIEYQKRYQKEGLRILKTRENDRICDCTIWDPQHFLGFLHVIKTIPLDVFVDLAPINYHTSATPEEAQRDREEARLVHLQLIERLYKPLLKVVTVWVEDPTKGDCSEWTRLKLEERFWVKKVPPAIAELLNQAESVFREMPRLRTLIERLVSHIEAKLFAESWLSQAGFSKGEGFGNVAFKAMAEGSLRAQIYPIWLWESGKTLSEYLKGIADSQVLSAPKWEMETVVYSKRDGVGRTAAGTEETVTAIEKIMQFLETQEPARRLREGLATVQELGGKVLPLIDEELE